MTGLVRERSLAHASNTGLWLPEDQSPVEKRRAHGFAHDSISVSEEDETGTFLETEEEALQDMVKRETQRVMFGRWNSRGHIREMGGPCGD